MSCPICWEDINNNSFTTICDHQFHKNCLERWLFNHQTCPMCREILYIKPVDKNIIDDEILFDPHIQAIIESEINVTISSDSINRPRKRSFLRFFACFGSSSSD